MGQTVKTYIKERQQWEQLWVKNYHKQEKIKRPKMLWEINENLFPYKQGREFGMFEKKPKPPL